MRVLLAFEEEYRVYVEAVAEAIHTFRSHHEVALTNTQEVEEQVERFDPIWQGESASPEALWIERENRTLVAAGFESSDEEDNLWSKEGVWFGRNAALQNAWQEWREHSPPLVQR